MRADGYAQHHGEGRGRRPTDTRCERKSERQTCTLERRDLPAEQYRSGDQAPDSARWRDAGDPAARDPRWGPVDTAEVTVSERFYAACLTVFTAPPYIALVPARCFGMAG